MKSRIRIRCLFAVTDMHSSGTQSINKRCSVEVIGQSSPAVVATAFSVTIGCIHGVTGRTSNIGRAVCAGDITASAIVAVKGEDREDSTTTIAESAPRFPWIERTLLVGVVLCYGSILDTEVG